MRAFWILSCLALAAAKPQYNYEQPAGQYYTSNVVQQQYPSGAYVGQQQPQLLPAAYAYTGQNPAADVQQSPLPVSYSFLGSSVAFQPQTADYPSQNIYTSYASSPSYRGLIASLAPGVSSTGYTENTSHQSGSNNGYHNNVYPQSAAQPATLAAEQTYLPAGDTYASAYANTYAGTLEQFPNQPEQLQATQAPVQQSATHDQSAISVSSQSADLAQQYLSVDQKLPESQTQEQVSLPEPSPLPQVGSTLVPQLEQRFQSGYEQTIQDQPAQTYLPTGVQQSFQNQPEQNYQSVHQTYQTEAVRNHQSVEVQQSVQIQPEQHYQSIQQTYETQPAQTHLPAEVHQSYQIQPEQSYQSAQQSYQAKQDKSALQSVQFQPEQNYQSVKQSYRAQPKQNIQSELQRTFRTQPEQSVQTQSEHVYQSPAVHSVTTHQQTFEPQTQLETEPRALQTTIHKSIYVHVPPKELEEEDIESLPVSPPKKHYKIIFIKAPSPAASRQIIQQIQPQTEEKTLVYVLVKKSETPEARHLQQPEIKPTDKPEVYFIKYRTQKNIEQVPAFEPTVQAVSALQPVETAPLASESTIIEPRQNQLTHPPQFPALEKQNNLLSTEGSNDVVQISVTTRRPHHHLRLNSSKHLQKSGARNPAENYLPAT